MKTERERELWLLKITSEHASQNNEPTGTEQSRGLASLPANVCKFRWGAIAIAGMTTASLVLAA